MKRILLSIMLALPGLVFSAEFIELHTSKPSNCAQIQQKSFNAVKNFVESNDVKGNYTAISIRNSLSGGCRLLVSLQNSDFKLVSKNIVIYNPSVWEDGTIEDKLAQAVSSLKKDHSFVLHAISERRNSVLNKEYLLQSIFIVRK